MTEALANISQPNNTIQPTELQGPPAPSDPNQQELKPIQDLNPEGINWGDAIQAYGPQLAQLGAEMLKPPPYIRSGSSGLPISGGGGARPYPGAQINPRGRAPTAGELLAQLGNRRI